MAFDRTLRVATLRILHLEKKRALVTLKIRERNVRDVIFPESGGISETDWVFGRAASNILKGHPLICEGRAPNNATLDAR